MPWDNGENESTNNQLIHHVEFQVEIWRIDVDLKRIAAIGDARIVNRDVWEGDRYVCGVQRAKLWTTKSPQQSRSQLESATKLAMSREKDVEEVLLD